MLVRRAATQKQRRKTRGPPVARMRGERSRAPDPKGDERVVQRKDFGVCGVLPGQRRREERATGDDRRNGAVLALAEVPGPGRGSARAAPDGRRAAERRRETHAVRGARSIRREGHGGQLEPEAVAGRMRDAPDAGLREQLARVAAADARRRRPRVHAERADAEGRSGRARGVGGRVVGLRLVALFFLPITFFPQATHGSACPPPSR